MTDLPPGAEPLRFTDNPMNPLEVALYEALADPSKLGVFERMMLEADLYAAPDAGGPGSTPGDDGPKVLRPGEQLILRGVTLNDGRDTVTLFTDPRRVTAMFGPETRILAMKGRNLLQILRKAVVLLNPDGGKGLLLNPDQIEALLGHLPQGETWSPAPEGPVELSDPPEADRPHNLIGRIDDALAGLDVPAAWLARARWTAADQPGWRLDVRTAAPADEVVAKVQRAIRGLEFGGEVFDVSVSAPGGEDGVGVRVK